MSLSLTTTSYAILGLLDLRSFTAYELAAQSQRSLRFVWPTAPSRLYAEPKRLAAAGLIDIVKEPAGPTRTRQVYRITLAGHDALVAWLRTEPAPPAVEAEVLLRVLFADAGNTPDIVRALERTRDQTTALLAEGREMLEVYAQGDVAFPERLHLNLLWATYIDAFLNLTERWTTFAQDEVGRWHEASDRGQTQRAAELLDMLVSGRSPLTG